MVRTLTVTQVWDGIRDTGAVGFQNQSLSQRSPPKAESLSTTQIRSLQSIIVLGIKVDYLLSARIRACLLCFMFKQSTAHLLPPFRITTLMVHMSKCVCNLFDKPHRTMRFFDLQNWSDLSPKRTGAADEALKYSRYHKLSLNCG